MRTAFLLALIMFCVSPAFTQEPEKTQNISLDSVTVKVKRISQPFGKDADGRYVWDMKSFGNLPQILSTADPLHYAQMLPGIQTNNEYQAGIHVQGSDNEHNSISINDIPLYNVSHLLGFFSSFITSHFKDMRLIEQAQTADFPNRLGAHLTMATDDKIPDRITGELSAGLMSSQGSLHIPVGNTSALSLSARRSYINMLYGSWLKTDDNRLKYSFYDANASLSIHMNSKHHLMIDAYIGNDDASLLGNNYMGDTRDKWGNLMVSARHRILMKKNSNIQTTLYTTSYKNKLETALMPLDGKRSLSAKIADYGLRSDITWRRFKGGVEVVVHEITPQRQHFPDVPQENGQRTHRETSHEASLYAGYRAPLTGSLFADIGTRGCLYHKNRGGGPLYSFNPTVRLSYYTAQSKFTLSYAVRHQYLFLSELSGEGIPIMSWVSSDQNNKPQYSKGILATSESNILNRRYKVSLAIYYKRLYNQMQNTGTLFDVINNDINLYDNLAWGNGKNYGASIMIAKCTGALKGWLCYSYGKALRTLQTGNATGEYPANHDRTHEINLLANYSPSNRWSFGACFIACTGTPFTAPTCLYMLNGNIISQMGKHNANRLNVYSRLDLSANYKWKDAHGCEHGINFSLYNALCHTNDLYHYVRVSNSQKVYYKTVKFVSPMLPSVSYFVRF